MLGGGVVGDYPVNNSPPLDFVDVDNVLILYKLSALTHGVSDEILGRITLTYVKEVPK